MIREKVKNLWNCWRIILRKNNATEPFTDKENTTHCTISEQMYALIFGGAFLFI